MEALSIHPWFLSANLTGDSWHASAKVAYPNPILVVPPLPREVTPTVIHQLVSQKNNPFWGWSLKHPPQKKNGPSSQNETCMSVVSVHLWKLTWNPKSWRFASDDFSFSNRYIIFRFHVNFLGCIQIISSTPSSQRSRSISPQVSCCQAPISLSMTL